MHLDFLPKINTIISRPIKYKNYYSKMQIGEKWGQEHFSQKGRFYGRNGDFYCVKAVFG